jgi:serine/threonine protein kinase
MNTHILPSGHLLHLRYSIQSCLGQGGFGITYLAYDQKLEQEVCIKELFVSGNSTRGSNMTVQSQGKSTFSFQDFVQRFVQEARQLAKFQHPNIVRVLDIFQDNDTAYMVMEYVKGRTLKQKILMAGVMQESAAILLITQLLDAVQEVHQKGMLHRDIKPDNILVTDEGRVVLIDFGSAREFAEGKTSNQTAMITPGYAPPEQYSDRAKRGPFTDIYALGATMYYMLTGEKPLPATDRSFEELVAPHRLNPKISTQVSSAIMLAMELKPDYRFQNISEMKDAMNSLMDFSTRNTGTESKSAPEFISSAQPAAPENKKGKSSGKNSTNKLALVFSLFTLAVIIGIFTFFIELSNDYDFNDDYSDDDIELPVKLEDETVEDIDSFICGTGEIIPLTFANDGDCDCDDCSDENPFECFGGKLIPRQWVNDEDCDCPLCDDED